MDKKRMVGQDEKLWNLLGSKHCVQERLLTVYCRCFRTKILHQAFLVTTYFMQFMLHLAYFLTIFVPLFLCQYPTILPSDQFLSTTAYFIIPIFHYVFIFIFIFPSRHHAMNLIFQFHDFLVLLQILICHYYYLIARINFCSCFWFHYLNLKYYEHSYLCLSLNCHWHQGYLITEAALTFIFSFSQSSSISSPIAFSLYPFAQYIIQ